MTVGDDGEILTKFNLQVFGFVSHYINPVFLVLILLQPSVWNSSKRQKQRLSSLKPISLKLHIGQHILQMPLMPLETKNKQQRICQWRWWHRILVHVWRRSNSFQNVDKLRLLTKGEFSNVTQYWRKGLVLMHKELKQVTFMWLTGYKELWENLTVICYQLVIHVMYT